MMKILLVEDGRMLRIANTRALTRAGYQVITAEDGEEALKQAREGGADLILLDMMLPKVSGLDVLRILKADSLTKAIPVIVLSSLSSTNRDKLIKEGAAAFLDKSEKTMANDSADLIEIVKSVLAKVGKPPLEILAPSV